LRFEGARTFRDFLVQSTRNDLLIVTAQPPVIRLVGAGQAQATTIVYELSRGEAHADSTLGEAGTPRNHELYGIYYDEVAKLDGEWKFTHRLFVPMYVRTGCVTGEVLAPRSALLRPGSVVTAWLDQVVDAAERTAQDHVYRWVSIPDTDFEGLIAYREEARRRIELYPHLNHIDIWRHRPESRGPGGIALGVTWRRKPVRT
jgi:hypothetical protein